jgi:hypothetical protein
MNSGIEKIIRGKLIESNGIEINNAERQDIKIKATSNEFKRCPSVSTSVD